MIFAKMKIRSLKINTIAASVFAVYLIHYQRYVWDLIGYGANWILNINDNQPIGVIPAFVIFSLMIFIGCVIIDKIVSPFILKFVDITYKRLIKHGRECC